MANSETTHSQRRRYDLCQVSYFVNRSIKFCFTFPKLGHMYLLFKHQFKTYEKQH